MNHAVYESRDVPLRDMTLEQWNRTLTCNLTSTFLVIRAFLKQLDQLSHDMKSKVAIVLVGSTAGKYGEAGACDGPSFLMYEQKPRLSFDCRTCRLCGFEISNDGRSHAIAEERGC